MAKITFEDKVALAPQPDIADINKVTDANMNEIKSVVNTNDDIVNKIGTIKQGFGDIFTSDGTYTANLYSHLVATYIGNGIWKIDYISRFENNSASSNYYRWGLSISNIGNLLNLNLQTITSGSIDNYSNWYLYNIDGNLILNKIDYGTVFEYYSDLNRLMPARIYNISGSVGGWGLDLFPNNCLLKGTIYLKEQE